LLPELWPGWAHGKGDGTILPQYAAYQHSANPADPVHFPGKPVIDALTLLIMPQYCYHIAFESARPDPMDAPSPPLPMAPPTLPRTGHYQLRHSLGEGGFGQVFEAWDEKLRRSVAIKRLKHDSGLQHGGDLTREAQLAASLRHTAFVKIYALEEDQDSQSIVMELVPGQTLRQLLNQQQPDLAQVLAMVAQVAEAMREAHEANLVHGDLKPSNLMQEPSGTVRILDFGLACQSDPDATASVARPDAQGTIAYMAPERLLGAALSPQSDIYALGVILYELASGQRPHANLSGMALAAAQVQASSDQWAYPASMSPGLVQLIRAMTAREPAQRLQSMGEVLTQIHALQAGRQPLPRAVVAPTPPSTSASSFWHTASAAIGRRKRIAATVLALGLLACGWQLWPYLADLGAVAAPFSESLEMKKGLAALAQWDRPGSLDQATYHFSRVLAKHDDNAAAVSGMALVYHFRYLGDSRDENWLQKASASAQLAIKLNDQIALSRVAQATVAHAFGKLDEALKYFEQALLLDPANIFAWSGKMAVLQGLHKNEESLQMAQRGLQRFPQERIFADHIGTIQYQNGKLDEAEQAFRLSLKIQPDAVYAYANLSAVLTRKNKFDEAMHVLQQGLQVRPSVTLHTNLGNLLFLRGNYVEAASAFEAAVSPTKGNPGDYLGWANLADTLLWLPGKEQKAREAYQKAQDLLQPILQRHPQNVTYQSRMALYSARVGDKPSCLRLLQTALGTPPHDASLFFRAGLAYELIGERELAIKALQEALKLGYPRSHIAAEPGLIALRRDSRFANLP
jgi:serine/threonine-protein kinase